MFSGALGVGIGFGLQKIVSNIISGIILLTDRSIKPGDVIEIGEAYGVVSSLGARYASVVTRDGVEYLIPNEDLITSQVVNWSQGWWEGGGRAVLVVVLVLVRGAEVAGEGGGENGRERREMGAAPAPSLRQSCRRRTRGRGPGCT